jgi:hypothetical protein
MAARQIVRTCAYEDWGLGVPVFTVHLAGGAWADFCPVRWPGPGIWTLSGEDAEAIGPYRWRALTDADRALLDATPAGRAWREAIEAGRQP